MSSLRALLRNRPALAALIVAAALLVRLLVPAGFMPVVDQGRVTVAVCNGSGPMTIAIPGLDHEAPAADAGCAFADLALSALPGADPVQLAALIAFILAIALVLATVPTPRAPARLRPPLRGPPKLA